MIEFNDHLGNFSVNVNNLNIDSKKIIYFNYSCKPEIAGVLIRNPVTKFLLYAMIFFNYPRA